MELHNCVIIILRRKTLHIKLGTEDEIRPRGLETGECEQLNLKG